jgi:hypothetical protein
MKERLHFLVVTGFSNLEVSMYRKDGNFSKILPVFQLSYTEYKEQYSSYTTP